MILREVFNGITSDDGLIPDISPRGDKYTSSFVKPTTSASNGGPSLLIMHTSPMRALGIIALISMPTTSVMRPCTVVSSKSSSLS